MIKLLKKMKMREWIMTILCAVFVLAQIFFDLSLPDYMSDLTMMVETKGSQGAEIMKTGMSMMGCALASAVLCVLAGYLAAKVAAGLCYTVRDDLFNKVAGLGQQEMNQFSVPSLINRTTNDITQVQMLVALGLQVLIKSPVTAIWAIIKIVSKSLVLSEITAGFVVSLMTLMIVIMVIVVPRFKRVQKLTDNINRIARENLTGINVVHAFNAEDFQNKKFDGANNILMNTQLFNQRAFAVLMPAMTLALNGLALVIFWVGAALLNNIPAAQQAARVAMFSNIVVFCTYATYVVTSLAMLVVIFMFLPAAQVSADRINEVLSAGSSIHEGKTGSAPETGTVEFRNVSFRYPDSGINELSGISFRAEKGQTVAIIGATGSGKTTLISLIARFYDAAEGEVLVDGVNVKDYTFEALYNRLGYIMQKAVLFSGDIRGNVCFGQKAGMFTDQDVNDAIEAAQASEFVQSQPKGTGAEVDQAGVNFSGGQKQRLSIARALARNPEILVFDDSFSALDYKTDAKLRAALNEKEHDTTKIIVAQRISTIRHADKIIVLDNGMIAGTGTHEELLNTCAVYREIAMSQMSAEELTA